MRLAGRLAIVLSLGCGCLSPILASTSDGIVLNVTSAPGPADVTLNWTGSQAPYSIYRSSSPAGVVAPANLVGVTNLEAWSETPPVGNIIYYEVTGIGCGTGADCPSGFCVDGVCCNTACNGTCQSCNVPGSPGTCTPIAAGTDPAGECGAGAACDGLGNCRKQNGGTCAQGSDCLSANCADGFCCDTACTGLCEQCNLAGAAGTCTAAPAGSDPHNDCPTDAVSTCGRTGFCSGSRTCSLYPSGTVCFGASCASGSTSNNPATCDGAGTCVDGGQRNCSPYACNSATGLCVGSCSSDAQCAGGFKCETSTHLCLAAAGQSCAGNSACITHACCSNVCRDLTSDPGNCGTCGTQCSNAHGTTACVASACSPTCSGFWTSCDGNPNNGCETATDTITNCGGCGVTCTRANAASTCPSGVCTLGACIAGFDNCDGNSTNGCESNHVTYPNSCVTATDMGSFSGDTACGFLCPANTNWVLFNSTTGLTSAWFHARVHEASDCPATIEHQIRLLVPAGVDYDLYVYRPSCGTLVASSTNGAGQTDVVTIQQADDFQKDDSFDYWVEVRYFGGSSCSPWTLQFFGHSC